jgi:hypothetical protein
MENKRMRLEDLRIGQMVRFDSDNGELAGTIIELKKYPEPCEDDEHQEYTYNIVAEVDGHNVNYNLSEEHILQ